MAKVTSTLSSAANKIVNINRSSAVMRNTQNSYSEFLRFMDIETKNLQSIKFDQKKLKKAYGANVTATFGNAGNLLSGLASGALDVGSFIGDFFGRGGKGKGSPKAGKAIPKGQKIRLPGVRGIGILAPLLAGLDFAQGISQGESVGKAASGAGGAAVGAAAGGAAGVALAGLIGQTLVPIPGLGFVLGAAVGGLGAAAGGYLADRAYESATGETQNKSKVESKLKMLETQQKTEAAALGQLTFDEVLLKFESVVVNFERASFATPVSTAEQPTGYDEELTGDEIPPPPEDTPTGGPESIKYGSGNAEFGETGNVSNQPGWVHGHFQGESPASVVRDTTVVVRALLNQGSPVYLNPGIDLSPSKKYSDGELRKYVEEARRSHTHSGTGKSIDVFVKKGTKVPVPLTNVGPTGKGFGGNGRGGIAGYIQGTRTWIGHLKPGSKAGLSETKGEIKGKGKESGEMEGLSPQQKQETSTKPQSVKVKKDSLMGQQTSTLTSMQMKASDEARIRGQQMGASKEEIDKMVSQAVAGVKEDTSQVQPAPSQLQQPMMSQQIQQYPTYIMGQNTTTFVPIIQGSGGSQPMVISSGGGGGSGGGQTVVMSGPSEGEVLNSLMKSILLTSLSAT